MTTDLAHERDFAFVIIAAGSGTRLGGVAKALLAMPDGRRDYLEQIAAAAMSTSHRAEGAEWGSATPVVVVGPPHEDAIRAKHEEANAKPIQPWFFVRNPDPSRGMASSIAVGFAYLLNNPYQQFFDAHLAAYLWPVDQPFVRLATLRALSKALADHDVARPRYRGRGGHPPLVARKAWPAFASCTSSAGGARAVIATLDVVDVDLDDPGVVRDVDTPEDLAEAPS